MNSNKRYERYQRQIALKEFGVAAQDKLSRSSVLVVGAGGLGCPAMQYLVAAGVGTVGIADDDIVSITNLHRQVLYNMNDVGLSKAAVAAEKLRKLNDEINIISYNIRLTNKVALDIIDQYEIVIDGTDNFSTRYMINDACVLLNKPLIYAAISRFEGQVAIFNVKGETHARAVNYRDLFPDPPKEREVLNCAHAGVIGVLPGIIGTMQANEAIKLITGIGRPLIAKMLCYNALDNSSYEFNVSLHEEIQASMPTDKPAFLNMDYDWLCSSQKIANAVEIDISEFETLIHDSNTIIIDVRERDEQPFINEFEHLQIPLNALMYHRASVKEDTIVLFCQTGKRSLQAADFLNEVFGISKKIYSLKGGIGEWKRNRLH